MNENKKKLIYSGIVFLTILIIIGVSYAFFTADIADNETASKFGAKNKNVSVLFTNGDEINANLIPGTSTSKTFTLKNIGEKEGTAYSIYITEISNTFINDELLFSMTCTSNIGSCSGVSETVLKESGSQLALSSTLALDEERTYTFTLLFIETGSLQTYNEDKIVKTKLFVE